jgi:hypothetical protein
MPEQHFGAIPIRRETPVSKTDELVADVAYALWHSAPFRCGPPEEAFFTALRMVRGKSSAGLFLVPKRKHNIQPIKRSSVALGFSP